MGVCGKVCCVTAVVKYSVFLALECVSMLYVCGASSGRLEVGYHHPACLDTDIGSIHHYRWRGGVDNNNNSYTGITAQDVNKP